MWFSDTLVSYDALHVILWSAMMHCMWYSGQLWCIACDTLVSYDARLWCTLVSYDARLWCTLVSYDATKTKTLTKWFLAVY